jgi:alpha/beta superfamily hydrolase
MFGDIRNSLGEKLAYDFTPGAEGDGRIVILGHGVTGNKDRPVVVAVAEALAQAGIACLRFSFAGNGDSEGRFVDCTVTKEIGDLGAVLDAVSPSYPLVAYGGHSMGGAVGVKRAVADDRIKVLVSLAGMVDCHKFAQTEFGEETPDEGCMWEEASCPLSSTYMNDMAAIGSIVDLGAEIRVPWLLLHGSEDDVVLIQDSIDMDAKATCEHKFVTINGADHSFSEHLPQMTSEVVSWVEAHLK